MKGVGSGFLLWAIMLFGLQAPPAVGEIVFTEDFESATIESVFDRWNGVRNPSMMSLSSLVPPGSDGNQSILMRAITGENDGAHLYKMLPEGYDSLFARFFVRFAPDHQPVHHLVGMGGYNPPTPWPQGGAGTCPDGTDRFTTRIEPLGAAWEWAFYTYWMHMRGDTVAGYWGNVFHDTPPVPTERGEWTCVEMMMKCNDPLQAWNGEQAFWIDGDLRLRLGEGHPNGYWVRGHFYANPDSAPFEGYQWRTVDELKVNFFWLLYYMTEGEPGRVDSIWFDDVVVATERIGPHTATPGGDVPARPFQIVPSPNPFNAAQTVRCGIPSPGRCSLKVYDLSGREVAILFDGTSAAGDRSFRWDAGALPSGVYLLHLRTPGDLFVAKTVLLR